VDLFEHWLNLMRVLPAPERQKMAEMLSPSVSTSEAIAGDFRPVLARA
jgi:hypothetical protein